MSKRMLVTGGAGFIGSNLVAELVRRGHAVTILDNFDSGFMVNLADLPQVRVVEADVREREVVKQAVCDADVVFHLAASVGNKRSIEHPYHDAEVNVLGTLAILEAAREYGGKRIVLSSSAGVFGELKTLPIREDHSVEPDSPYGATKLCAEKLCLAYSKLHGVEVIALRYFNVYGPNQRFDAYGNVIPIFIFQMLRGAPVTIFGDGEQTRDFLHVRDAVQANIRSALAAGVNGVFNLGSGTRITINELASKCREVTRTRSSIEHGPPRPGDVRHSLAEISAARRAFGFEPLVPLDEGLTEYADWARQELRRAG